MPDVVSPDTWSKMRSRPAKREVVALSCAFGLASGLLCLAAWRLGPGAGIATVAIVAAVAAGAGHVLGFRRGRPLPSVDQLLLLRVADELAQYRAFTRLLRDQGHSITETTASAATSLAAGLVGLVGTGGQIDRLAAKIERGSIGLDRDLVIQELRAISDPMIVMLGTLQFQDVTQQQIEFLNRLSLILDDHMMLLSKQLGDRRSSDRIHGFREMFDQALNHCVMADQRNDHNAARDLAQREETGLTVELF
jgi:hypothetical protein